MIDVHIYVRLQNHFGCEKRLDEPVLSSQERRRVIAAVGCEWATRAHAQRRLHEHLRGRDADGAKGVVLVNLLVCIVHFIVTTRLLTTGAYAAICVVVGGGVAAMGGDAARVVAVVVVVVVVGVENEGGVPTCRGGGGGEERTREETRGATRHLGTAAHRGFDRRTAEEVARDGAFLVFWFFGFFDFLANALFSLLVDFFLCGGAKRTRVVVRGTTSSLHSFTRARLASLARKHTKANTQEGNRDTNKTPTTT